MLTRNELYLSDKEVFDTRSSMYLNLIMGIIPITSILIVLFRIGGTITSFSVVGFAYWLYPIVLPIYGKRRERRRMRTYEMKKAPEDEDIQEA